jgi:arsenate reductase
MLAQQVIRVFGIPNCDTVKKARAWLQAQELDYVFHDFKKAGVPEAELTQWVQALGWQALLNQKGSTWRKLSAEQKASVVDADSATALMRSHVSVIKRPVVHWGSGQITLGFDAKAWGAGHLDV